MDIDGRASTRWGSTTKGMDKMNLKMPSPANDAPYSAGTETDGREPRRMLNEKQLLEIIPIGRSTLHRMLKAGKFPRAAYISPNRKVWFQDDIIRWQDNVDEFNPARGRGKGQRPRVSVAPGQT